MAQVRKVGPSKYRARIRITGYPHISKTFDSKAAAVMWATERDQQMRHGLGEALRKAEKLTLASALARYAKEVTPLKKGAMQEHDRINLNSSVIPSPRLAVRWY